QDFDRADEVQNDDDESDSRKVEGHALASSLVEQRFYGELQLLDSGDADERAGGSRVRGHSVPIFATNKNFSFRGERGERVAGLPDHAFFAGDNLVAARSHSESEQQQRNERER